MKIQKTIYQNTEAASITSARKKAREFCEGAVYGSRELLDVQKEVNG